MLVLPQPTSARRRPAPTSHSRPTASPITPLLGSKRRGDLVGDENTIHGLWPAASRVLLRTAGQGTPGSSPCSCDCPTSRSPACHRYAVTADEQHRQRR